MFEGRRRGALRRAMGGSDWTAEELKEKISSRQETIARLELELFDIQAALNAYRSARDHRLGPFMARIKELESEIEEARRAADYRAIWKGREDAPDFESTVSEQFRKAWTSTGARKERFIPLKPPPPVDREELRKLYRSLAKRFHPDLTTDSDMKLERQELMAAINQAYMDQDQARLLELADTPDIISTAPQPRREHQMLDMFQEIDRLDALIMDLNKQINELNTSDELQMALEFSLAQYEGRDLLGEYERYYRDQIRNLEKELAYYRS